MISFYPGPSRIYDEIPGYVREAARLGIMSINHRSPEFVHIYRRTEKLLKQKLRVPNSYTVLFTSSATECWEVIAQSLSTGSSTHVYNGAFGRKWYDYTQRIRSKTVGLEFDREELIDLSLLRMNHERGIVCLTQNETSNGTQVSKNILEQIKKLYPSHLLAVDATSSMGGINLDYATADIWFASVQKCFGLPAGMGVMLLSPAAVERANEINERAHYNSLPFMIDMATKHQTSYTPNVISIYLLMRVLEKAGPISTIHKMVHDRYKHWAEFLLRRKNLQHLISNEAVHSYTVLPVKSSPSIVTKVKRDCIRNGFLLGEGYGDLKTTTFRIANFPAMRNSEIKSLTKILAKY